MASSSHTCIVAFVKIRRYLLLLKSGDMGEMDDIFVICVRQPFCGQKKRGHVNSLMKMDRMSFDV